MAIVTSVQNLCRLWGFLREPNKVSGFWSLTMVLLLYKKIQWLHKCQLPTINSVLVTKGRTSQIPKCWGLLGVRGWEVSGGGRDSPSSHGVHTQFSCIHVVLRYKPDVCNLRGQGNKPPTTPSLPLESGPCLPT